MGENIKKIGNMLFSAREEQGVEVADVAARLRISESYLYALECGDASRLPEPVYTEAYIIGYAKVLDIPSDPLVALYRKDDDIIARDPAICFSKLELQLQHIGNSRSHHHTPSRMLWLAGAVVAIILLTWYSRGPHFQSLKEELFPVAQKESTVKPKASLPEEKKSLAQNNIVQNPRIPAKK